MLSNSIGEKSVNLSTLRGNPTQDGMGGIVLITTRGRRVMKVRFSQFHLEVGRVAGRNFAERR